MIPLNSVDFSKKLSSSNTIKLFIKFIQILFPNSEVKYEKYEDLKLTLGDFCGIDDFRA